MKTLYLLRHGKSDWESDFNSDHERGLSSRGVESTHRVGKYWNDFGFSVDLCLCSDAIRCRKTWEILSEMGEFAKGIEYTNEVYESDSDGLFDLLKSERDSINSILIIGHNPSLEELAEYLVLGENLEELHNPLFTKFPTSAFLGISLSVNSWKDITPGHGSIITYWIPGRKGR